MIPSELNRMSRSAAATGPFGSRTPSEQPPSVAAPIRATAKTAYRMLDLVCAEPERDVRGSHMVPRECGLRRSDGRSGARGESDRRSTAVVGQQRRKQNEQVQNGECK